jgi:hypothetical protein
VWIELDIHSLDENGFDLSFVTDECRPGFFIARA